MPLWAPFAVSAMFLQIVIGRINLQKVLIEEWFVSLIILLPIYHSSELPLQSLHNLKCHKRGSCLKWGIGFAISSLSMLFCDSYFDMRFKSDKKPTVDIEFNSLKRIKNLLLTSNQKITSLLRKNIVKMKKMTLCKSGILMTKTMGTFCLFIKPMAWREYIEKMYHV